MCDGLLTRLKKTNANPKTVGVRKLMDGNFTHPNHVFGLPYGKNLRALHDDHSRKIK